MSNNKRIQVDFGADGGMSLFIPYVHGNATEEKIRNVIERRDNLGVIRLVKFLNETNKTTGKEYKMVYVYFEKWNETKKTRKFQKNVQANGGVKVKYNDGIGYWTILPNKHWVQKTYKNESLEKIIPNDVLNCCNQYNYNDTYESLFNSDLRVLFDCEGIIV
jgi:hypothetical protein